MCAAVRFFEKQIRYQPSHQKNPSTMSADFSMKFALRASEIFAMKYCSEATIFHAGGTKEWSVYL